MNPRRYVFDFDGTITTKDTISYLTYCAIRLQQEKFGKDLGEKDLELDWLLLQDEYKADLADFSENIKAAAKKQSRHLSDVREWLNMDMRKEIDQESIARVEDSGIFEGITAADFLAWGKALVRDGFDDEQKAPSNYWTRNPTVPSYVPPSPVRLGFVDLLGHMESYCSSVGEPTTLISIISVNWSSNFIRGVIEEALGDKAPRFDLKIYCNDFRPDGILAISPDLANLFGVSSTDPTFVRVTSRDKLNVLKHLRTGGPPREEQIYRYFGDSATDLECLVDGGGVAIARDSESSELVRLLRQVGFKVPHFSHNPGHEPVTWARNFEEVCLVVSDVSRT